MFKIIAQHTDFIVVNKAAGTNFHDEEDIGSGLHSLVKNYLQKTDSQATLYPVHRLDKMTSGLVIFAKNLACAQVFGQLFSDHEVEKYYLAIADKKPGKKQGLIKGDMAKSRRGMFKLLRSMNNPAITQFFSYSVPSNEAARGTNQPSQRLYLLKPHSGKTHQLRVALASIGAPIVGDPLYYSQSKADRGYLHAYALRFNYLNKPYEFICPPEQGEYFTSESITHLISELKAPWSLSWPKRF